MLLNVFIFVDFYGVFEIIADESTLRPVLHKTIFYFSVIFLSIAIPSFILSVALEPGYLRKKFDFIDLVDEMIERERDLWNLCTYCELIKSQTSFHCLYCGCCIELFDHHCPYVNNCLGSRNTKFFLIFVATYFLFLVSAFMDTIRFIVESLTDQDSKLDDIIDINSAVVLLVLIALNLPLAAY